MPRNANPKRVVSHSVITSIRRFRTSAKYTASAMKMPDVIRIAVFAVPSGMLNWFEATTNGS